MEPKPTYNIQGRGSAAAVTLLADLLEHITALKLVIDAQCQTIEALQERIKGLESDLREYQE